AQRLPKQRHPEFCFLRFAGKEDIHRGRDGSIGRMKPPFRADHVGSLLRPKDLAFSRKEKTPDLKEIQARAIREVVARQEASGLEGGHDGEFSRDWWDRDFMAQL